MKFTIVFFICSLQLSAQSYSQEISINVNNANLEKVFKIIERQSGYHFFYKNSEINQGLPISIKLDNVPLEQALIECFEHEPFSYQIIDENIIVKLKPINTMGSGSKDNVISGTVKDERNQPIPGASVRLKDQVGGVITDRDGKFSILAKPDSKLLFSCIGYKTTEVAIAGRFVINIILQQDENELTELVVVGYGHQERRNLTSAISTVKMDNINGIKKASVDLQLAGQMAGVTVNQVTGTPGGGVVVRVRGSASTGAGDDPLYVIDGFPISSGFNQNVNPLSTINPDDIESISVLKDAASTAIYGSRGANGVILITTKRAKIGQSIVTLNTFTGVQANLSSSTLHMMDAAEFAQFRLEAAEDLAKFNAQTFDPVAIPKEYQNPTSLGEGTNWYNEITRPALMQNYNLTVANGSTKMRSLFSIGYFDQRGTILNTGFKRYSLRANLDFNITKDLTIGFSLSPSYNLRDKQETDGHFENGILTQALLNSPIPPVRLPDGTFNPRITSPGMFVNSNPINAVTNTINKQTDFRALTNVYANWNVLKRLSFKTTFGADYNHSNGDTFRPSFVGGFRMAPPQLATGSTFSGNSMNWLNENTINYNHQWGYHSLSFLGGFTIQNEVNNYRVAFGTGYSDDAIYTLNGASRITADADRGEWRLLSLIGRINYDYHDKYLLTGSIRKDGSSRFAPGHQWGTFPSISAGWRISSESFFPKTKLIDQLKFTMSYGLAGNNSIGNYAYIPLVDKSNYVFGGALSPGSRLMALGNENLGWETTRQFNVGLDLSMLGGRMYFVGEYYNRYTKDMLSEIELPIASGFNSTFSNVGNVRNRGWEFTLTARNINQKYFSWTSDLNISFNRNKVISLGTATRILDAPLFENTTSITQVGSPLGMFYGYVFEGIYQNQAEIDRSPHFGGQIPGSIKYKDVNGDGVINGADRAIIGNPYPNFTFGFNNRFRYKKIDLNIVMAGSHGGHVFDLYKQFTTNLDGVFNVEKEVANRWRSESNPGSGILPTTNANTNLARDLYPSHWVKSNSYIAFKDITLGYSFKTSVSQNLRIYLSAQNALLLTAYKGGNPEVSMNSERGNHSLAPGINFTGYPVSAVYTMGINLTL